MKLYEFFIGFRYLKSKKNQGFISFNTILSIFMVFLGVFILIVVLSVMNGFQSQIKDKILDVDSHITITYNQTEKQGIAIKHAVYQQVINRISGIANIKSIEPYIQGIAIMEQSGRILPIYIRAMGTPDRMPEDISKFIEKNVSEQTFATKRGVFIGSEMAAYNMIAPGDRITLTVLKGRLGIFQGVEPVKRTFTVVGTFKTGYYEFDSNLIIMSLPEAQRLYRLRDGVRGISIKVDDVFLNLDTVEREIQMALGNEFIVETTRDKHKNLFQALDMEKFIMGILLFLIVVAAGFMILGTVVMVVMEKRKAIGILKSMGATPFSITVIFTLEGFIIGMTGTLLGVLFGLAAALNLESILVGIENSINAIIKWKTQMFNPEAVMIDKVTIIPQHIYYIDGLPTQVDPELIVTIAAGALFIATIAAIFPAWQASKAKPVETIRYE